MGFLVSFLHLVSLIVLIDAISSWVVGPNQFPRSLTGPLTDPLYRPLRAIFDPQKMGGMDISPLVLILGLNALAGALPNLIAGG